MDVWRRLHEVEGPGATVIDLYELIAAPRGLEPHELPVAERLELARAAMELVWPGYTIVAGSERTGDPLEIVDCDPEWPNAFARWQVAIRQSLGDRAMRIDHIGSTSVPGLPAKPTVDILICVSDLSDEPSYAPGLEAIELQLRSRDDLHRYFRPVPARPRDVHVHVCALGSDWQNDHLLFRDFLRAHPDARDAYARVKRDAAVRWRDDRIAYTDAKSALIGDTMRAASAWSASSEGIKAQRDR